MQYSYPQRICLIAILMTLVVVSLGAWTRLNNAGLGCPDWPGCFGQIYVPNSSAEIQAASKEFAGIVVNVSKGHLEMVHRYFAGTLGLLMVVIAYFAFRARKIKDYPVYLSYGLLAIVIVQGLFGMWTVTLKLLPVIVTIHLLGGLLTLALLVRLYQKIASFNAGQRSYAIPSTARNWVLAGLILLFIQLALGGWTSANYAGWSCTHWWGCTADSSISLTFTEAFQISMPVGPNYEGGVLSLGARAAIQMTHRAIGIILFLYLILLAVKLRHRRYVGPLVLVVTIVICQLGLGVANIVYALPLYLAMAHHWGAVLILLSLLWLYQRVTSEVSNVAYEKSY